ncbi:conserved membrane hypothetical protein [Nostocoides japonicum T1-X7]|uniref:Uncharacterized protein n=1 Tax=Nostocoides japonicum T1-X7 TaxID=1194083 RepID=A0A077M063_9MICO|nr:hypothetical protein [Tetrasphaera japonica]CCH79226.1 conserved membrane hypothetical protein [Tetrasphaera japonica T1-X7]
MAYELLRRRVVHVPRRFGIWLLFLVWVIIGVFVVQVVAPGAVMAGGMTRYLTWGFRLLWYIQATVILLYVGNLRREVSVDRVCRVMGWMFITIVFGGLLGVLAPRAIFPSLLEVLLPNHIAHIPFVAAQVHPNLAELQNADYGPASSRPSAPFPYANVWGLNYACFLPFFVAGWMGRGAGRRRYFGVCVMAVSVVPVIYSLNRGLWGALGALLVFAAIRSAMAGRLKLITFALCALTLTAVVLFVTPLGAQVENRFTNSQNSNDVRVQLTELGFAGMSETSPIVGFGTTRSVQSSFGSIAVGSTANCPLCTPPALGTQGHLLLVSFAQGWGGVALYYAFLGMIFLRYIRLKSPPATAALSVILIHVLTSPVYSADNLAILAIFCAVAVLWREALVAEEAGSRHSIPVAEPSLGGYSRFLRRHAVAILVPTVLAVVGAASWSLGEGSPSVATISVLIPPEPVYPGGDPWTRTLDTEAQFAYSAPVLEAMSRVAARPVAADDSGLSVTAIPNSRILNLSYQSMSPTTASAVVSAAAQSMLDSRNEYLRARQTRAFDGIDARSAAVNAALGTVDDEGTALDHFADYDVRSSRRALLKQTQYGLLASIAEIENQREQLSSTQLVGGRVLGPARVVVVTGPRTVRLASGLGLGLLVGLGVALLRELRGRRLSSSGRAAADLDVPVVNDMPSATRPEWLPATYLSVDDEFISCDAAARMGDGPVSDTGVQRIVLVCSDEANSVRARVTRDRLKAAGADVIGVSMCRT